MHRKNLISCLLFLLVFTGLNHLYADENPVKRQPPVIVVSGDATIQAAPDRAQLDISVITQSTSARNAAKDNAEKSDRVIKELRKASNALEIKTTGYSLRPNYSYPPQGGEPKLIGYIATNTIQAQTDSPSEVGVIIDAATKAGANNVDTVRFMLKDELAFRSKALSEAAGRARQKADAIAQALGVKIVRIQRAEESTGNVVPFEARTMMKAQAEAAPTPVEPGTLEIQATISLTVEIE
jgi:uncharacterized protein YggE